MNVELPNNWLELKNTIVCGVNLGKLRDKKNDAKKNRRWAKDNPEKHNLSCKTYYKKNPEKFLMRIKAYLRRRMETDPEFRINYRLKKTLSRRILLALKKGKKSARTLELTGCTLEYLKTHIQSLWLPGMSWGNHGLYGWHIDHKIPVSSFDLTDPDQQRKCFHWTNLQPLWAKDNFSKGAKFI